MRSTLLGWRTGGNRWCGRKDNRRRPFDINDLLDHHRLGRRRFGATADIGDMAKPTLLQDLLNTLDGEAIMIKQSTDAFEQIDIFGPVITPAASALDRLDLCETAFPETQHMLRHVEFTRDFTDGAESFRRLVRIGKSG